MDDALAAEFKTLGVTSRLDKPFTEMQLAEALASLLAPKRPFKIGGGSAVTGVILMSP